LPSNIPREKKRSTVWQKNKLMDSVAIAYTKSISETFKWIGNCFQITISTALWK